MKKFAVIVLAIILAFAAYFVYEYRANVPTPDPGSSETGKPDNKSAEDPEEEIVPNDGPLFNRALVTIMFDDGWARNPAVVISILDKYGFKTSHCYLTSNLAWKEAVDGMLWLDRAGHEICSHGLIHEDLTLLSPDELQRELRDSKRIIEETLGKPVEVFVSPFGIYNDTTLSAIKDVYRSHRGTQPGYNTKENFDAYALMVKNVFLTTTASEVSQWIAEAQAENAWLIILYHEVHDEASEFGTKPAMFEAHMQAITQSGVVVKTYSAALNECQKQTK